MAETVNVPCKPAKPHGSHPPGVQLVAEHPTLLVFNKPAGLLSVPGKGEALQDCLSARVQALWPEALVVHRLDMATSGLIVLARGPAAQRSLSAAFAERQTHKRYEAVVWGRLNTAANLAGSGARFDADNDADAEGWHTINLPLIVDWPNRPRSIVSHEFRTPLGVTMSAVEVLRHPVALGHLGSVGGGSAHAGFPTPGATGPAGCPARPAGRSDRRRRRLLRRPPVAGRRPGHRPRSAHDRSSAWG